MELKSDPDQNAAKLTTLPLKELAVLLPILASAVAIAYDVGYFYTFDLDYFSFFSLSEHIVFALQALPLALMPPLLVLMFFPIRAKPLALPPTWKYRLIGVAFILAAVAFSQVGSLTLAAIAFCGAWIVLVRFSFAKPEWPIAVLAVPIVLVVSMATGVDAANQKKYRPARTHVVKTATGDVEGTLIRSGAHGVFFHFAATKEVGVIRWDSIKEIVTKKTKPDKPPWFFRWIKD